MYDSSSSIDFLDFLLRVCILKAYSMHEQLHTKGAVQGDEAQYKHGLNWLAFWIGQGKLSVHKIDKSIMHAAHRQMLNVYITAVVLQLFIKCAA